MNAATGGPSAWSADQLAAVIDHTLLKPEATPADIGRLCEEAIKHRFHAVCVNPIYVAEAARLLGASPVRVCTVAGFPLGASRTDVKVDEARRAIDDGAVEIDMVLWIGGIKARRNDQVRLDIEAVAQACHKAKAICKVILETCLLTPTEKETACRLCVEAGADFVKTSTGLNAAGATVEDVRLMKRCVADHRVGIKAAGGIRTLASALAMLNAGATRIGTSNSVAIIREIIAAMERESQDEE